MIAYQNKIEIDRAENFIYQATIKTDSSSKIYIGLSANQLKNV